MAVTWLDTRPLPLADLTPFPGNPRRGNITEIRASIRRNGQYRSLVVRDHDGTGGVILAGNNTAEALLAEGYETARCEILTCTDEEARRINTADNRLNDIAGYDDRLLAELLTGLDSDYDGTGFDAGSAAEVLRASGMLADQATNFLNDFRGDWQPPVSQQPPPPAAGNGTIPPPGQPAPPPPDTGNRWVQVSWMVNAEQRDTIHRAVTRAKHDLSLLTSADAVTAIASHYLGQQNEGDHIADAAI